MVGSSNLNQKENILKSILPISKKIQIYKRNFKNSMHISSSVFNQSHNSLQLEGAIVKKAVFIRNQKSNCENARKKSINNHNHLIYWLFSTYSHTAKSPPSAKENCFLICDICKSIFIYINLGLNSKINKLKGETWKKKKPTQNVCLCIHFCPD